MSVRALGKQSLIYGFGHIISRLITFLLLPIYTNVFTRGEYGVVSLVYAFIGFAMMFYRYGTDTALMKFYSQEKADQPVYLTTILLLQIVTGFLFSGFLILSRSWLSPILFAVSDTTIIVITSGILFCDTIWTLAAIVLRSEEKPVRFVLLNLINVMGSLGLNIYFVVGLHLGIRGVLYSNLIVSAFLVILTLPFFFRRMVFHRLSPDYSRTVLRFALPFLPAGIFTMIMELSNRYFLNWLTDTATVGVYSAGYKLGMFGLLIVMGFNMGWTPYFLKQRTNPEAQKLFARVANFFTGIQGLISVIIILWIQDLVTFRFLGYSFFGESFWESTVIVPIILLGYMFFGLYVLQHPAIYHTDNTRWVVQFRAVGAVTAIVLNLALIPLFGIMGSAWASCMAYAFMAGSIYRKTHALYPIPYRWTAILFPVLAIILTMILPHNLFTKLALPMLYAVIWVTVILPASDRKVLRGIISR
ncbi:MAG: lipopolysaccharide biosynthesis protein [Fidelibacterota bacterium]